MFRLRLTSYLIVSVQCSEATRTLAHVLRSCTQKRLPKIKLTESIVIDAADWARGPTPGQPERRL